MHLSMHIGHIGDRVGYFGFETSRFWNFSNFLDGIGFGIEKIWYRKKYRIRYRKKFGIEKSIGFGIGKIWYRKKYRIRYRKLFGIEKSIGFGIINIWYHKKVSDSVSLRYLVSSYTGYDYPLLHHQPWILISLNFTQYQAS